MEKPQKSNSYSKVRDTSISEQGFTYIEMIVSFALVTTIFPLLFSLFYQVSNDVRSQLATHQLFHQFDRFHMQLQKDEANGIKMFSHQNKLEVIMKDGIQVRYQWKQGQLIRAVKQTPSDSYRGNTILLYHVKRIHYQNLQNGIKMKVVLADQNATYTGVAYVWGRIDE